jgi:predicted signal transduction protein with EAL and GGDEF domain
MERLRGSVATARLREQPLALAIIYLDAVGDIARTLDAAVAERVTFAVLDRLRPELLDTGAEGRRWYLGKLAEDSLGLAFECGDRDQIEARVADVCRSLGEPVGVGDAAFHLTPYAGVAVLGTDADAPNTLLRHARAAADESRRAGSAAVRFFSDTLKLRSLARLDIARELREAIADGAIGLRYAGRHDLATGQRVAWVGYLRWTHALRGEVRPAEFVNVAQATGQARALSRAVLECLRRDFPRLMQHEPPDVRISFGALRHHVLHEDFCRDIAWLVGPAAVPADRLELRIAERTLVACETGIWSLLSDLGIRLVVDEVGREMSSLDRLARVPLWGLQLDRSWASALRRDPVALRVCGAGVGVATSLGLTPIATGVDDAQQRDALRTLGCRQAMGDLYPSAPGERHVAGTAAAGQ